ncbi:MAG TPA: ATP-binding protein [Kofleriaceae bacterium]|nr:ATP-binding protein [Kofleriaceae bacterium]
MSSLVRVTAPCDEDTERRSSFVLGTSAIVEILLCVAAVTTPRNASNAQTWAAVVKLGIPSMLAAFWLARRAAAGAAAALLSSFVVMTVVVIAWTEGASCVRMTAAILGLVIAAAVLSARVTTAMGLAFTALIVALGVAQDAGSFRPSTPPAELEPVYAPFLRQSIALGALMLLLRRGYDRVLHHILDREHARHAAVTAARALNGSLEDTVAQRTAALVAARDRLSDLASQLASDVGDHLGGMRAQLGEIAGEPGLGESGQRHIAKAVAALDRLAALTRRLHEHADIGSAALRRERVDLVALVRDVVDEHGRGSEQPAIEWIVEDLPPAWADPTLVRMVIDNLVGNAIKYSRRRAPARIRIGHDAARGYFIEDNGVGFDPRLADRLFSPFQRLHDGEAFEGHGLGLANVRRILQRLGGDITAHGEPDRGATFAFHLPMTPETEEEAP